VEIVADVHFYRIRHIPTGLYYQPVKGRWDGEKSNISKNGKVYPKRPPKSVILSDCDCAVVSDAVIKRYDMSAMCTESWSKRQMRLTAEFSAPDMWEIVEYKLVEVNN
jgi:hypothetical protein